MVARMLAAWLGRNKRFAFVGSAHNGVDGLTLCHEARPDVVILDIMMPGTDGITLAERLLTDLPEVRIVMVSARFDPYGIYRIQRLGIPGCVDKSSPPDVVSEAIIAVASGGRFYSPFYLEAWQKLRNDPNAFFKILSDREIDFLRLLVQGLELPEIANRMNITFNTVRTHQRNIRNKLGAHNTVDLLAHARRNGLF